MSTKLNKQSRGEELCNAAPELHDQDEKTFDTGDQANQQLAPDPIGADVQLPQHTPERPSGQVDLPEDLNMLTISQLACSVPGWSTKLDCIDGAVERYRRFEAADATETALALVAVGLTNATMDGLDRANRDGLASEGRQIELKLVHKTSAALVDVLKTLQSHRREGDQKVSVETVNIGSGAQAIVGNVRTGGRRKRGEDT
jgi:hypothetical protein